MTILLAEDNRGEADPDLVRAVFFLVLLSFC